MLNVGGNNKNIPIPKIYDGWQHVLLDISPKGKPDIVCDARKLNTLKADEYDAIYCSHNLEHYYRHEVFDVLAGFLHVLKPEGFVHLRVPDINELMQVVVKNSLDIDDVLYKSPAGPITVRDVMYGYGKEIEESGNDFFAHKTGFTAKSLSSVIRTSGFNGAFFGTGNLEITAYAFKNSPSEYAIKLLNLSMKKDNGKVNN